MPFADHRGDQLRAFDHWAHAFVVEHDTDPASAAKDVERLFNFAATMAADLMAWRREIEGLGVARRASLDPGETGRCVIEAVFDTALCPTATRLLASALDLAWTQP